MPKTTRFVAVAAAALGMTLAAGAACAETATVSYADLDLATAKGQRTLEARLDRAAQSVCRYNERVTGSLTTRLPGAEDCYAKARAKSHDDMAAIVRDERVAYGG